MYSLTIHFGPNAMVWSFLFKDKERAEAAFEKTRSGDTSIVHVFEDDFGQKSTIAGDIHGSMLEDMDLVMEARIYRSLENTRGEIKAKQRASTDPVIRTAQQGPGVIAPNFGRN
jgi:hypothetical protein